MKNRNHQGQSIVELLIATLIFSSVATVMLALYSINVRELSGFFNKGDVMVQATDAISKIGKLVRSARGFGDNYGVQNPAKQPMFNFSILTQGGANKPAGINVGATTNGILSGAGFLISPTFPSVGDPYYGSGALPASVYGGNWPFTNPQQIGAPSGPGAPVAPGKYTLGPDCLIVQVPVFVGSPPQGLGTANLGLDPKQDAQVNGGNGAPYIYPATWDGNPLGPLTPVMQAVDTYVFRVLPDPNRAGTFMMQEAAFPACPNGGINGTGGPNFTGDPTNVVLSQTTPTTLCTGIVGPLDQQGNLNIFSYVEKLNNTATTNPSADAVHYLTDYSGLIVNLEVLKNSQGTKASVAHFKTEFYLRNNAQVQLMGPPSN